MSWYLGFAASAAALALFIIIAIILRFSKYKRGRVILTPFHAVFAGVFISVFICLLPIYSSIFEGVADSVIKTIAFALHNTFQIFTFDADRAIILESIKCEDEAFSELYSVYLAIEYAVAPVLTFSFLISFFKDTTSYIRYILHYFHKHIYIFSELNEKSLALGRNIKKKHRHAVIVYTDVFENNDEVSYELGERAKELNAICFKKDILAIRFKVHSKTSKITFYAIGQEETENINQSLQLIKQYRDRENVRLFVFSSRLDSEILLTNTDKGKIEVRRINEARSLINQMLYTFGCEEILGSAKLLPDGDKKISAVVVGLGGHGTEMLKALSWYCQMDGYHLQIDAFDKDVNAESKFIALAPELMSEKYNGVVIPGEAEYKINIHSGIDVATAEFADKIKNLADATYVFVSLGSDEMNIRTAVELRTLFERMKIKPVIHSIVYNADENASLKGIKNYSGQDYNIRFVGDINTSYSESVIMNSELEQNGLACHLRWDGSTKEEFLNYEYNYNSSIASAIHLKARIECHIPGADKLKDELTEEEEEIIARIEHCRWNAYMRAEGYVYSGSNDESTRNDLGKMHHDLVDYDSLKPDEKAKDIRLSKN